MMISVKDFKFCPEVSNEWYARGFRYTVTGNYNYDKDEWIPCSWDVCGFDNKEEAEKYAKENPVPDWWHGQTGIKEVPRHTLTREERILKEAYEEGYFHLTADEFEELRHSEFETYKVLGEIEEEIENLIECYKKVKNLIKEGREYHNRHEELYKKGKNIPQK